MKITLKTVRAEVGLRPFVVSSGASRRAIDLFFWFFFASQGVFFVRRIGITGLFAGRGLPKGGCVSYTRPFFREVFSRQDTKKRGKGPNGVDV